MIPWKESWIISCGLWITMNLLNGDYIQALVWSIFVVHFVLQIVGEDQYRRVE